MVTGKIGLTGAGDGSGGGAGATGASGVTLFDALEAAPVPTLLLALTVKV